MNLRFALIGALALAAGAAAQENYATNWSQHKNLYVHTGATRANVAANVTKFPLLVRLNSTNFNDGFAQAKGNGADIRFTKAGDAVRLPHQIETWDSAGKNAAIWVLMDTVYASTNNQLFRLHWGNAAAADSSKGSAVFDTANGFVAVWHMNETTSAAGATIADATGNGNTGKLGLQGTGTAPTNVAMIGNGKTFGGAEDNSNTNGAFFSIRDSAVNALNLNTARGPFTITAWANPAVCASGARITVISQYDNNNVEGTRAWALQTSENGEWRQTLNPNLPAFQSATAGNEFKADYACNVGQWTYLAGRYESSTDAVPDDALSAEKLTLNVNGDPAVPGITASQSNGASIGASGIVFIGRLRSNANANNRFMRGSLDEITVSKVRRSDAWIKLSYETQKPDANAVSDATITSIHGSATGSSQGFSVIPMAGGLGFRLPAHVGGAAVVSITDMKGRTVWSRSVSTGASESVLAWNGISGSGQQAAAGLYAVTVSLRGANGEVLRSMSQKVSFAP